MNKLIKIIPIIYSLEKMIDANTKFVDSSIVNEEIMISASASVTMSKGALPISCNRMISNII
jgi:hypothetical protein